MEEVWLIGSLAVTAPLLVVCAFGWWRSSRRARWLETQVLPHSAQDDATQRLELAVEGLATQVNELANGQDFLQRILAKKAASKQQPLDLPAATTPV